ncbi:transcriptional regulator, LysR family protein [Roseobacter sp. SK209-2-6]|uniref:LysR substrate-binding domain-containing protein n=1 Tax=Roseobacter sp. SK209-2-6 TaxID=388739 RepID=UPI0000F3D1E7|nr:LysR substrate-binding domain-containing protein [Roseobacter sp. SK209-2-6]EBA16906.1 transcriptional regulator, LysR family protein [Roseobacter sp. SK209-2-6]
MKNSLPPLGWLRTFEAAARHLSFTGAARDLNMTQSAVSQQIKGLESHLGKTLFHRRPRALELTPTGTTYLPVVREAFRTLMNGTRAISGPQQNVVQVQSNISFAVQWLSPRLGRFYDAHPDVLLNISTEIWEPRGMAEGADVEIRFSLGLADTVRGELLHREHYYPVCAPGYEVMLEDLHQHRLFDCANLMANFPAWAEDQGLPWPNPPVTYTTTYMACLPAVVAGAGVGMAHDIMAGDLLRQGRLIAPFAHRAPVPEAYYLLLAPQAERSTSASAFADWLRGEIALESIGRTDWPEGFRQ